MDNKTIKTRAKEINRASKPSIFLAALILISLSLIMTTLSQKSLISGISESVVDEASSLIVSGDYYSAMEILSGYSPSAAGEALSLVMNILKQVVLAGFVIFTMNTVRNTAPCLENLLDGFGIFFKLILLLLLEYVFVLLWSLLLVVPGIIALYKYRLALFILIDNPDMGPMDCLRKSKELMSGHKGELFRLDLSFIGWFLLASFFEPVEVYFLPYRQTSYVLFYQELIEKESSANWFY